MSETIGGKAAGGFARAAALSPEDRKAIARKAAAARWDKNAPQATHEGDVHVANAVIPAAVLPNKTRVLSQGQFLKAIGRARSPKAKTGALSTVDELPFFLSAEVLKPFITNELRASTKPIFFLRKDGRKAVGYDARLLPMVCDVYLKLRDHSLAESGKVPEKYAHIIQASDILMRGLAHVGIVALVDEATGFQEIRDREALQEILDRFLRREFAAWAKKFPDEFYKQIFRLRGWTWKGMKVNRPQVVAHYTNELVYNRLAPRILEELKQRNPTNEKGHRKAKHHQWLTEDIGHPALAQHLYATVGFMRVSKTWDDFVAKMDLAFPKRGDTLQFDFMIDPIS